MSRMFAAFKLVLHRHPFLTNSVVYGTLFTGAELCQQTYNMSEENNQYDWKRLGHYALYGTTIQTIVLHNWYKWLDAKYVGNATKMVVRKVFADQFICTPPLLAVFFLYMSVMEGREDIWAETREKYWPTYAKSCGFWLPAQTCNFFLIPKEFRVVYTATCSFLWLNILCFIRLQKNKRNT